MSRMLSVRFGGFVGVESWKNWMPFGFQARSVAKKAVRAYKGIDLAKTPLYIFMIDGSYRVLDSQGTIRKETAPSALQKAGR